MLSPKILVIFMENLKENRQVWSGVAIFISVVIALVWANSPWQEIYHSLIHTEIAVQIGEFALAEPLLLWVNDGLMAVFFLFVGLELKREILGGRLSNPREAILPIGAAIGGMVLPAMLYSLFNFAGDGQDGWGIPMATDIAFALGVLTLFGKRVPVALKVFLVALAIVDDLGAVLVIAFFYTSNIVEQDLLYALLFLILLIGGNYFGIRGAWFYALIGIGGVWLAFFFSGVHPTIAGILIAFAIPGKVRIKEKAYLKDLDHLHQEFIDAKPIPGSFISEHQLNILERIKHKTDDAETPLQKIEHALSPIIGFFILPLFALVNAGIHIHGDIWSIMGQNISLGILVGLIAGKFIGISGTAWLLVKFKIARLGNGVTWGQLCGVALIAGIGFTMSLFITDLAFQCPEMRYVAKLSILLTSALAGILGSILLWFYSSPLAKKSAIKKGIK
tara:strand:- start:4521 stop:5864 length:1344 start_codon:yes stop_codon:yes gene_type:complete